MNSDATPSPAKRKRFSTESDTNVFEELTDDSESFASNAPSDLDDTSSNHPLNESSSNSGAVFPHIQVHAQLFHESTAGDDLSEHAPKIPGPAQCTRNIQFHSELLDVNTAETHKSENDSAIESPARIKPSIIFHAELLDVNTAETHESKNDSAIESPARIKPNINFHAELLDVNTAETHESKNDSAIESPARIKPNINFHAELLDVNTAETHKSKNDSAIESPARIKPNINFHAALLDINTAETHESKNDSTIASPAPVTPNVHAQLFDEFTAGVDLSEHASNMPGPAQRTPNIQFHAKLLDPEDVSEHTLPQRTPDIHFHAELLDVNTAENNVNKTGLSGHIPSPPSLNISLQTEDGLEERIAKHFNVAYSAAKLNENFVSPGPSAILQQPAIRFTDSKMMVVRALDFSDSGVEGCLSQSDLSSASSNLITSTPLKEDLLFQSDLSFASSNLSTNTPLKENRLIDDASLDDLDSEYEKETANEVSKVLFIRALGLNDVKLHDYTDMSVNEGILSVMQLYLENHDSKSGLERSLSTISKMLPADHKLPSTSYRILKYIISLAPPIPATCHYYCKNCLFYHGIVINGPCEICVENQAGVEQEVPKFCKFYTYQIMDYLKFFFECRNLASAIDAATKSRNVAPDAYSDIQDGSVHKLLNTNRNKYDINLMMNTDGVRIRKSSTMELWLLMFSIVEVPIKVRESFIIFSAVWYDGPKPNMNTLLKPSCEELAKLDREGFEWKHPANRITYHSKVRVTGGVMDAPARAIVQNVLHFNGEYGCNVCEIKTIRSKPVPNKKRVRIYPYKANLVLRDQERMEAQARQATEENKKHVMGVKGPSVLALIPSVDVSNFFIPEYMHSVLLGVVKQLLTIWTSPGEWSIKHCIGEIDRFLAAVKHPDFVHRAPRVLEKMKFMKASDFYYFLIFEGLPSLQGRLPQKYFQHYMLLVKGIHMLLLPNITEADIDEADQVLNLFVQQFQQLYSDRQLTYNTHQLCHLALTVRRFGPLSCNNAFIFENINGLIAKATHGTNNVATEIINNIKVAQGVQVLKGVINNVLSTKSWCADKGGVTEVLGRSECVDISDQETAVIGAGAQVFARIKIGNEIFTSELYKKVTSENFHVMLDGSSPKYGAVKFFATNQNEIYVCVKLYKVNHLKVFYHEETRKTISHLVPVVITDDILIKNVKDVTLVKVGKIGCFLFKNPVRYAVN